MKNYVVLTPRFSDFNLQGILKASTHLDLACEAQLAQMEPRYNLPLFEKFAKRGLRWHIAEFDIKYPKVIRPLKPIRIEADVVAVEKSDMIVDFRFADELGETEFALGRIRFELVDGQDSRVPLDDEVITSLRKYGRMK